MYMLSLLSTLICTIELHTKCTKQNILLYPILTNTVWAFFITIKLQDACLPLFYEQGDYFKNEQSYYGKYFADVVHASPLEPYNSRNL